MLAMRVSSSGPWHEKQFSERMGRICRSKSMGLAFPVSLVSALTRGCGTRIDSANFPAASSDNTNRFLKAKPPSQISPTSDALKLRLGAISVGKLRSNQPSRTDFRLKEYM